MCNLNTNFLSFNITASWFWLPWQMCKIWISWISTTDFSRVIVGYLGFQGSYTMYSLSSGERSRLALLVELLWVWLIGCCSGLEFLELLL